MCRCLHMHYSDRTMFVCHAPATIIFIIVIISCMPTETQSKAWWLSRRCRDDDRGRSIVGYYSHSMVSAGADEHQPVQYTARGKTTVLSPPPSSIVTGHCWSVAKSCKSASAAASCSKLQFRRELLQRQRRVEPAIESRRTNEPEALSFLPRMQN